MVCWIKVLNSSVEEFWKYFIVCIVSQNSKRNICVAIICRVLLDCLDLDECKTISGTCDGHMCINTPGSYVCQCKKGYQKVDSMELCQGNIYCCVLYDPEFTVKEFVLRLK